MANLVTAGLSEDHRAYLRGAAVTDEVMDSAGIHSRPGGIAFPYRWDGEEVVQFRPDRPGDGAPKYVWPKDTPLILNRLRETGTGPVLLVEGTKQALAVASWAPAEYSVYGMVGCWGWSKCDLSPFEGRDAFIVLDGDASDSLDVYTAGARLAEALDLEDAESVRFVRLPVEGKEGADDYLGSVAEDKRSSRIAKMISRAKTKPADRKPAQKSRKPPETAVPDTDGRPGVAVNLDRRDVINKLLGALKESLDATELFNFGGALTRLRDVQTVPLDNGTFLRLLADTVACFHYTEATDRKPAVFTPAWPDSQTVQAVMSSPEEFSDLHRVVRTPFVRPDGTVCMKEGYDELTRTVVVLGDGMDRIRVSEEPERTDVVQAARFLLDDWLSDMPFKTQSDRANALALVLTPFVRGSVPLVPMGVVSGLQMGVGKNLFADCVSVVAMGEATEPLPYIDDEDETRKQITSAFRGGANMMVFDEAHVIESKQLARALTAITYTDRVLGVSKMVAFPNQATWMALGNRVQVNSDMARRVYYISLHPREANPQDRDSSSFRHADLRGWTQENRPELVSAALTVIRGWHAAGRPSGDRGSSMGSFESWDRMMSGILAHAGVAGFLGDLVERRSESDFTTRAWTDHLMWLHGEFGENEFTTGAVKMAAVVAVEPDPFEAPPGMEDVTRKDWTRELGKQYSRHAERWYTADRLRVRILKMGIGHTKTIKWRVETQSDDPGTPGSDAVPRAYTPEHDGSGDKAPVSMGRAPERGETGGDEIDATSHSVSGDVSESDAVPRAFAPVTTCPAPECGDFQTPSEVTGGNPQALRVCRNTTFVVTSEYAHVCVAREEGGPDPSSLTSLTSTDGGSPDQAPSGEQTETNQTVTNARGIMTNERGTMTEQDNPGELQGIGLDLETHGKDELFTHPRGEYVRLVGAGPAGNVTVTSETALSGPLTASGTLVGHNHLLFDLVALDRHEGIPVESTAPRAHDLRFVAFQADPPHSGQTKPGPGFKSYSLNALAARYLSGAKSPDGKALAREFGGWGNIPVDDPRYVEYCRDDVSLALRLAEVLPLTDYDRREAQVAAVTARATLEGFRVDVEGLTVRTAELEERSAAGRTMLSEQFGFPLLNGQGKPSKAPQRTSAGKSAFRDALASLGFPTGNWPLSKDGSLSLSKPTMGRAHGWAKENNHPALSVIEAVQTMNGIRNNAANLLRYVVDGRVHPRFEPFQATGRWSVQEPGLTVLKKKSADSERAFLLPEEGHVLVSIDLDQVDIRCVAAHSQDPVLLAIMNDPSRDIHSEIAVMAFGDAEGDHRHHAKSLDLGWLYGRSVNGMVKTSGVERAAAVRVDASMRQRFGRVMQWQEEVRDRARAGALLNNGFGRNLRVEPGFEHTQPPAMMGQSTTRDLIAEGLLDLRRRAPEMLPMLRVIVHDEIVASVPEKDAEECARILQDCMSREWAPAGASNPVRITAGQGKPFTFGRNWAELYL